MKRKPGPPKGPLKERLSTLILPATRKIIDSQGNPGAVIDQWAAEQTTKKKETK